MHKKEGLVPAVLGTVVTATWVVLRNKKHAPCACFCFCYQHQAKITYNNEYNPAIPIKI